MPDFNKYQEGLLRERIDPFGRAKASFLKLESRGNSLPFYKFSRTSRVEAKPRPLYWVGLTFEAILFIIINKSPLSPPSPLGRRKNDRLKR